MLISKQGQVIRLRLKGIPTIGRATQGVRIMRMAAGDQVASVALMQAEKIEAEISEGQTAISDEKPKPADPKTAKQIEKKTKKES